ncbi:hypothetical protein ID866_3793 [Astraeus odoratus]|nr:hypothetical protein ID866_3793 [Astraeus odoratus]
MQGSYTTQDIISLNEERTYVKFCVGVTDNMLIDHMLVRSLTPQCRHQTADALLGDSPLCAPWSVRDRFIFDLRK